MSKALAGYFECRCKLKTAYLANTGTGRSFLCICCGESGVVLAADFGGGELGRFLEALAFGAYHFGSMIIASQLARLTGVFVCNNQFANHAFKLPSLSRMNI